MAHHATVIIYDRKLNVTLAGATAVSLMALGIMNYIKTLRRIFLCFAECCYFEYYYACYADCHYTKWHYAQCDYIESLWWVALC